MPHSKTNLFGAHENTLSQFGKALSHPARIAILKELAASNTCVCGEIVQKVPLAQATVSQHLKELKQAGLIKGEVEGPTICYCLDLEGIEKLHHQLGAFLEALKERAEAACC